MKFILGFAVGVVLAILYAPAPGEETRGRLAEKARDLARLPQQKAEELARISKEKAGDLGGRVGRQAAEAAVEAVRSEIAGEKSA